MTGLLGRYVLVLQRYGSQPAESHRFAAVLGRCVTELHTEGR